MQVNARASANHFVFQNRFSFHELTDSACGGGSLLLWQTIAIVTCSAWACVWTFLIFKFTAMLTAIRVSDLSESVGLDLECHGEMCVPLTFPPRSIAASLHGIYLLRMASKMCQGRSP